MSDPKVIGRKLKFDGESFAVYRYDVQLGDRRINRDIIERKHGVVIVPVHRSGHVVMVNEYCAGSNSSILSLPGGSIDSGESADEAAIRELREETGFDCKSLRKMHFAYSHPSTSTRMSHAYLAYDLYESPLESSGEILETEEILLDDAIERALDDFTSDVSTIGLLLLTRDILPN